MDGYRYVLKQACKDGTRWTSPEVFEGSYRDVCRAVIAGVISGEPRWAETAPDASNPGFFLYGIDRLGKAHETGTGSEDFPSW